MVLLLSLAVLVAWLVVRLSRPVWARRGPAWLRVAWRFLLPAGVLAVAASRSPGTAAVALGLFTAIRYSVVRTPGFLRREVLQALGTTGARPDTDPDFPERGAALLLERYASHGMQTAEAVAIAGRCTGPDDLAAQIALRERGLSGYAAYLRRFGHTTEIADPDTAAGRDRFPGGGMGRV